MFADTAADRGRGYRAIHRSMILVVIAAALATAAGVAAGVRDRLKPEEGRSAVRMVADGSIVPHATSIVTRDNTGIDITLQTSGLPKGHVIVLKAMVFNAPGRCLHGAGGFPCGDEDLSDPAVDGSVVFVAANQTRGDDRVRFSSHLSAGDATRAASGRGLTDTRGAAVRLIIADHGPPLAELFRDQITTLSGGCKDAPPNSGTPGPNNCTDLHYANHP